MKEVGKWCFFKQYLCFLSLSLILHGSMERFQKHLIKKDADATGNRYYYWPMMYSAY
jgi:hypothetical protein